VKRLGQFSVIGVAALAVWLALPSADERASVGREPSKGDARRGVGEAPRVEARIPAPTPARSEVLPTESADPSRDGPGRVDTRAASERGAAKQRVASAESRAAAGTVPRRDESALVDSRGGTVGDTQERFEEDAPEPVRRSVRSQRRGVSAPGAAPGDPVVGQEVSDVAVTSEPLDGAGEGALDPVLEQEMLLDELARASLPEDASEADMRRQRELARSLLSAPDETTLEFIRQHVVDTGVTQP
jgi:hypothetical protein